MSHTSESLQKAFGYLFPNEVKALKQLAQSLPPNPIVVNIGAGAGTSGLTFMESRPDLFLYTVDIQKEDSPLGCLAAEERVIREAGYIYNDMNDFEHNRGWQFHTTSISLGRRWLSIPLYANKAEKVDMVFAEKVDMVFIDGDHSYAGCKGDIEAWLPNLKLGGIMALHDYRKQDVKDLQGLSAKEWPDVDRAVSELLAGKYEQILLVDSLIAFKVK